jgi:hypothetical protein
MRLNEKHLGRFQGVTKLAQSAMLAATRCPGIPTQPQLWSWTCLTYHTHKLLRVIADPHGKEVEFHLACDAIERHASRAIERFADPPDEMARAA